MIVIPDAIQRNERVCRVFRMWNKRLLRTSAAHYMTAERYARRETYLSIANIGFAITVLFLTSSKVIYGVDFSKAVPIFSLLVVISSAIQYILQYSHRSGVHKQAGNEFSNLRRKLERYWTKEQVHPEAIHALNRTYNQIAKIPPLVPKDIWDTSLRIKQSEIDGINQYLFLGDNDDEIIHGGSCP